MRICLEEGAAISHHHGIGRVRLPWFPSALGNSVELLRRLKGAFDPAGLLSPGRLATEGPGAGSASPRDP